MRQNFILFFLFSPLKFLISFTVPLIFNSFFLFFLPSFFSFHLFFSWKWDFYIYTQQEVSTLLTLWWLLLQKEMEKKIRRKKIVYVTIKKAVGKNKITDKTDRMRKEKNWNSNKKYKQISNICKAGEENEKNLLSLHCHSSCKNG